MTAPSIQGLTLTPQPAIAGGPQHVRASVNSGGASNGESLGGDISADGRYVVFLSTASNLVAGDTNGTTDIFRKDLWTGAIELVSSTSAGVLANGQSGLAFSSAGVGASPWSLPTISENGRYVGFTSYAQNLPGAQPGELAGYVKDMVTGRVVNVTVPLGNALGVEIPRVQAVSMGVGSEALIAFTPPSSLAIFWGVNVGSGQAALSGPAPSPPDVSYLSVFGYGRPANSLPIGHAVWGWSVNPPGAMFQTWDNIAAAGDSNDLADVFVARAGELTVISRQIFGPGGGPAEQSNQPSFPGFMSYDGRYSTFFSSAANIEAGTSGMAAGGVVLSSNSTVWVHDTGSAAETASVNAAVAQNRAVKLSVTLDDATRFTISWGDGTSLSGGMGDLQTLAARKIYAANGSYTVSVKGLSAGGVAVEGLRLHLLALDAAANLTGSNIKDLVFAGNLADALHGRRGDDEIHGGAGNDSITGGAGADTIFGGAGNDLIFDGPGEQFADIYVGGAGHNAVSYAGVQQAMTVFLTVGADAFGAATSGFASADTAGGPVADLLYDIHAVTGGNGGNVMTGSAIADTLIGGTSFDSLQGAGGNDLLNGMNGDDILVGGIGADTLSGGNGNDLLAGEDGANLYLGGFGNDVGQSGTGAGEETFLGGAGNDVWLAFGGNDSVDGGPGIDMLMLFNGFATDLASGWTVDMTTGVAILPSGERIDFRSIEVIGGGDSMQVTGTARGEKFLLGNAPAAYDGGGGQDTLSGAEHGDGLLIDASGAVGTAGGSGREGGPGPFTFLSIEAFEGGTGADTILGGAGAESIHGGAAGDDLLQGGGGADSLAGGLGADTFIAALTDGNDSITDFASGEDMLAFSAAETGLAAGALDAANFALGAAAGAAPQFLFDAATGQLSWDADGTGAGAAVLLARFAAGTGPVAGDIIIA